MKKRLIFIASILLALCIMLSSCSFLPQTPPNNEPEAPIQLEDVPAYDGKHAYIAINGNVPFFTDEEKATVKSFESYSELDSLGRCGVAFACIGKDLMPTDERGSLSYDPTGWVQAKYDGQYLYNRCHLIGWQLTGENNNKQNLMTGTRYFNIEGMLTFEDMVADYIKETNNHVMYRVTPIYASEYDMLASGALLEAWSVEDDGDGICFNVYSYNVQPGIVLNYLNGNSYKEGEAPTEDPDNTEPAEVTYVLNTSSKKIHKPDCRYAESMSEANKEVFTGDIQQKISDGYTVCGTCNPLGK